MDDASSKPCATPFQDCESRLTELVLPELQKSPLHDGIGTRFRQVLILCDRLLASCEGGANGPHGQVGLYGGLPRRVKEGLTSLRADDTGGGGLRRGSAGEDLNGCVETWLKAVLLRVDPDRHLSCAKQVKRFNLTGMVRELQLLDTHEADKHISQADEIADEVKRYYLIAQEWRNSNVHGSPGLAAAEVAKVTVATLVLYLGPVDRYLARLQRGLSGLLLRPLKAAEQDPMASMRDEQAGHLAQFSGRRTFLQRLVDLLPELQSRGGYALITAPEGGGKSATIAALTHEFASAEEERLSGPGVRSVRAVCPWLPGVVLYTGKTGLTSRGIVSCLLAQIETQLLEPLGAPELGTDRGISDATTEMLSLRSALRAGLSKLTAEKGSTVVVLDALDEVSQGLGFLPRVLPPGCAVLMTCRDDPKLLEELNHDLRPIRVTLDGLTGDDVLELVEKVAGVADPDWCGRLCEVAQGTPLFILDTARELQTAGGDLKKVVPSVLSRDHFARRANAWRHDDRTQARLDPARRTLFLLSILEPVAPISWSLAAAFLRHVGVDMRSDELREALNPFGREIIGFSGKTMKLRVRPFAEYVREVRLEGSELREHIEQVATWLGKDDDAPADLRAKFLLFWAGDERPPRERSAAERLIDVLVELNVADALFAVFRVASEGRKTLPTSVLRCAKEAAQLGATRAQVHLGLRLLDGVGIPQDQTGGAKWLRTAADAGDASAMQELGERILDGPRRGFDKDPVEGERWLRRAIAEGNDSAVAGLALRKLLGVGVPADTGEAESLLHRGVANDGIASSLTLLHLLATGLLPAGTGRDLSDLRDVLLRLTPESGAHGLREAIDTFITSVKRSPDDIQVQFAHLLNALTRHVPTDKIRSSVASGYTSAALALGLRMCVSTDENEVRESQELFRKVLRSSSPMEVISAASFIPQGKGPSSEVQVDLVRALTQLVDDGAGYAAPLLARARSLAGDESAAEAALRRGCELGDSTSKLALALSDWHKDQSKKGHDAAAAAIWAAWRERPPVPERLLAVAVAEPLLQVSEPAARTESLRLLQLATEAGDSYAARLLWFHAAATHHGACLAALPQLGGLAFFAAVVSADLLDSQLPADTRSVTCALIAAAHASKHSGYDGIILGAHRLGLWLGPTPDGMDSWLSADPVGMPVEPAVERAMRDVIGKDSSADDWEIADNQLRVSAMSGARPAFPYTHALWGWSERGCADGHLGRLWLWRHGVLDLEADRLARHLVGARAGGYDVPDWLGERHVPAGTEPGNAERGHLHPTPTETFASR